MEYTNTSAPILIGSLRITACAALIVFTVVYVYYNYDESEAITVHVNNGSNQNKPIKPNKPTTKMYPLSQYVDTNPIQSQNQSVRVENLFRMKTPTDESLNINFSESKNDASKIVNFVFPETLTNFLKDTSITDTNLDTFRAFLLKESWMNKSVQYFNSSLKTQHKPEPLGHANNTCFLVSTLHCIRATEPLSKFVRLRNRRFPNFPATLEKIFKQKKGSISNEDFNNLLNIDSKQDKYIFGQPDEPWSVMDRFFMNCRDLWKYMNFSCITTFYICEGGHIISYTNNNTLIMTKNYPLLELNIDHTVDSFNLQKMLNGTEIATTCDKHGDKRTKVYELPLFTSAAPFLIFNFSPPKGEVVSSQDNKPYDGYSMILQDVVRVPTLFNGVNTYELTGFTLFISLGKTYGHYIAFVKYECKWYKCDMGSVEEYFIEFPLILNKQLKYIITTAFYKKTL